MEKITREQIASYLNVGTTETPSYAIIGIGITEYGIAYNPQITTEKWIIHKNASNSLESYQVQGDVTQTCYKGDPVFEFINDKRRKGTVGSNNDTDILDIDMYDSTKEGEVDKYKATKANCTIAINNYGGETASIEYSVYYNGDPIVGTVTIANGVPTFTADASV